MSKNLSKNLTLDEQIQKRTMSKKKTYWKAGDTPLQRLFINIILIFASLLAIYPILRLLTVSLRPVDMLLTTDLRIIPEGATLNNFIALFTERDFLLWLWNSVVIAFGTVVLSLFLSTTAAYAFARWRFPGYRLGQIFVMTQQMLPAGMLLLPIYIIATRLRLTNTYTGIIIAYACGSIPFSMLLLKGYFESIPKELEEAAHVDGATTLQSFTKILLPLATPAISITGLFAFMNCWNEFMMARVMLQKNSLYTWPLGIRILQSQFNTTWGQYAAASILVAVPVMALFLWSSKYIVSGLTLGGVKD
ncbi:MAG TPA: carbohydrate ABC transporter permease [Bacillota bacterium]|nr:carbohydrate ABC transporter permease [Bacillota bacterium]HPT66697.1 carbohydrate ABC transporter permease [Bacillota bacterium]